MLLPEVAEFADESVRLAGIDPEDAMRWPEARRRLLEELTERAYGIAEADGLGAPTEEEFWMAMAEFGGPRGAARWLTGVRPRQLRVTPIVGLALLLAAVVGIGAAIAVLPILGNGESVRAEEVFALDRGVPVATTDVWVEDFFVAEGYHELQLRPSVYVANDGAVEVSVYKPSGELAFHRFATARDYFVQIVTLPADAGEWRVVVELHDYQGPVQLRFVGLSG